jgi:hypothetical protein
MNLVYMPNLLIEQAIAEKKRETINELREKNQRISSELTEEELTNPFFGTMTQINENSIIQCNRVCNNPVVNAAIETIVSLCFDKTAIVKVDIKKARQNRRIREENQSRQQQVSSAPVSTNNQDDGQGEENDKRGASRKGKQPRRDVKDNDSSAPPAESDDKDNTNGEAAQPGSESSKRKAPANGFRIEGAKPPDPTRYKPDVDVEEIIRQRDSPTVEELKEHAFLRRLGESLLREYLRYGIAVLCVHNDGSGDNLSVEPLSEFTIKFCTRADSTRNYFCSRKHSTLATVVYEPRYFLVVVQEPHSDGHLRSAPAIMANEYHNFEVSKASATVSGLMQLIPMAYGVKELKPEPAFKTGLELTDAQLLSLRKHKQKEDNQAAADDAQDTGTMKTVPSVLMSDVVRIMENLNGIEHRSVFQVVLSLVTQCIDNRSALMKAEAGYDVKPMPKPALIDITPHLTSFVELVANSFGLPPDFYSFQSEKLKAQAEGSQRTKNTCINYHLSQLEAFFDAMINNWLSISTLRAQDRDITESDTPLITVDNTIDPITSGAFLRGNISSENRMVLETPLSISGPVTRNIESTSAGDVADKTLDELLRIKAEMLRRAGGGGNRSGRLDMSAEDQISSDVQLKERILIIPAPSIETMSVFAALGVLSNDTMRLFASLHMRVPPSFLNSEPTFPVMKEGPSGGEGKEKKPRLMMEKFPGTPAVSSSK